MTPFESHVATPTRFTLSLRSNHISSDLEGPVLSVSSIIAIVIAISLTIATIITIIFFIRQRSRAPSTITNAVASPHNAHTHHPPDIELVPPPLPVITASSRSSTYDRGVPPYDSNTLPGYLEKPPPSPSPSRSSRSS